ncbi:MAG: DsbA family protein [Alphaproteobacteria bacterium]
MLRMPSLLAGFLIRLAVVVALAGFSVVPAAAEMNDDEKREIERIVRNYLLTNPEIIEVALDALDEKRKQEERDKQALVISQMQDKIYNSEHQIVLGNPQGKVSVVEFFDYNCGFCRRAMGDMMALMETNPDLKFVLKELPILSEGSVEAARVAIAVGQSAPEIYVDFHREMFSRGGPADGEKALAIATDLGMDRDALVKLAKAELVDEALGEVRSLAMALGINGTPSYVVGGEAVFGAVGYDQLQARIVAARECETVTC